MRPQTLEINLPSRSLARYPEAATAASGGWLSAPGRGWYRQLDKPPWQPPGWLFGPVWTVLCGLAATSAIAAWHTTPAPRRPRLFSLYGTNAVLNAAWIGIFFRARQPALATADSAALLATTVALIHCTRQNSRLAAFTLTPYAAWVAFATAFSGEITRCNTGNAGR